MRITLATIDGETRSIDVSKDMEIVNLMPLVEAELGIPAAQQELLFNGQPMADKSKSLSGYQVSQDDVILVRRRVPAVGNSSATGPTPEMVRQMLLNAPGLLQHLSRTKPAFADAIRDPSKFLQLFNNEEFRAELMNLLKGPPEPSEADDPMSIEYQRRIEEKIREENIALNMERAMEEHPESFGRVIMLYINCEVNGQPVKAFVDSGAQATIMSPSCAERCNIMHLLDTRFKGIAKGVGTANILGRIHSTHMKVGTMFLHSSFTIMEGTDVELLFGLDMLKRHLACIDLAKNVLRIGNEEVPFLAEHELPANVRNHDAGEPNTAEKPGPQSTATATSANSGFPVVNASAHANSASSSSSKYSESVIKGLMDLGVSRDVAISSLDACQGNADLAASLLFQ